MFQQTHKLELQYLESTTWDFKIRGGSKLIEYSANLRNFAIKCKTNRTQKTTNSVSESSIYVLYKFVPKCSNLNDRSRKSNIREQNVFL